MPQDTVFELPFAPDVSPDADGARRRSPDWCRGLGLVTHPVDQQRFLRWDIAGLMAAWLPRATGDRLDPAVDAVVVATFLDDQFDGPLADQPLRVAAACRAFTDVIASAGAVPAGAGPLTAAFAQVWIRLAHRASPAWLESAGQHWRWYVNAYVEEAGNRAHRHTPSRVEHFALRRRSGFVYAMLDLSQKAYGFELPPRLGRDPTVRRMPDITADVEDTLVRGVRHPGTRPHGPRAPVRQHGRRAAHRLHAQRDERLPALEPGLSALLAPGAPGRARSRHRSPDVPLTAPASRVGGRYSRTYVRSQHAPVSRSSRQLVYRYRNSRARTKRGGVSGGKGERRSSRRVSRSFSSSRSTRPPNHSPA
ncbi:hypothetical protein FHS34_003798 [Streptomyces echinatus]|uniref:Uncharacterized protein n=1 Tax=Streptomyces echinatus TaxID=67293 RepID=A0A7W9PVB4_9ACTN|nr:hypothetical protein [Streptomyces echinatus]